MTEFKKEHWPTIIFVFILITSFYQTLLFLFSGEYLVNLHQLAPYSPSIFGTSLLGVFFQICPTLAAIYLLNYRRFAAVLFVFIWVIHLVVRSSIRIYYDAPFIDDYFIVSLLKLSAVCMFFYIIWPRLKGRVIKPMVVTLLMVTVAHSFFTYAFFTYIAA